MQNNHEHHWSLRRRISLAAATIIISFVVSFTAAEFVLRTLRGQIETSEQMQPGLILYDRHLGWRLAPKWRGRHRHYDYDVEYTTNRFGFRGGFPRAKKGRRYGVLGDSFTFGFGVEDHQTFVHLLNIEGGGDEYLNFAVPGYSTDQELLLLRRRVLFFQPDEIMLVVYMGNDLFDNELAFPLQAEHGKPFFRLSLGKLVLENSPVPMSRKPAGEMGRDLASMVLPETARMEWRNPLLSWLGSLDLARWAGLFQPRFPLTDEYFRERFAPALELFRALIRGAKDDLSAGGITFKLALLPGRSFVETPGGYSALYQDYLRRAIINIGAKAGVEVIDLALHLRLAHEDGVGPLFFPNEGHLTAEGHRIVLEALR